MEEEKGVGHCIPGARYANGVENERPADVAPCVAYERAGEERRRDATPTIGVRPAMILPFLLGCWEIVEKRDYVDDQLEREHHGDTQVPAWDLSDEARVP